MRWFWLAVAPVSALIAQHPETIFDSSSLDPSLHNASLNGTNSGGLKADQNLDNSLLDINANFTNVDPNSPRNRTADDPSLNAPVFLTLLFFLDGRSINPGTGDTDLPAKPVLTFGGGDTRMAVQLYIEDYKGRAVLAVRRLWENRGFNRNAVAFADTVPIEWKTRPQTNILGEVMTPEAAAQAQAVRSVMTELANIPPDADGNTIIEKCKAAVKALPDGLSDESFGRTLLNSAGEVDASQLPKAQGDIASAGDDSENIRQRYEKWKLRARTAKTGWDRTLSSAGNPGQDSAGFKFSQETPNFDLPKDEIALAQKIKGYRAQIADNPESRTGFTMTADSAAKDTGPLSRLMSTDVESVSAASPKQKISFANRVPSDEVLVQKFPVDAFSSSGGGNAAEGLSVAADETASVGAARVSGVWSIATLVTKSAMSAINVAGLVVGAAFIIVDFVNGNLVGGSLGLAGLAAGVGVGLAFSAVSAELGPLGWFIGGLVSLMFLIIPGMFNDHTNDYPTPVDVTGILQWTFFGNISHTGNEKCRTDTPDFKANPNCTAVFGPAFLSHILNISQFDAAMLVINFNYGYGMSIDNLETSFQVVSPQHPRDTASAAATIDCHNKWDYNGNEDNPRMDRDFCLKPTYSVNRTNIMIPVLNMTAEQVHSRLIPNGDCRIVTYPEGQYFPAYNLTAMGLPTGVACGISPGLNVSGVLMDLDSPNAATGNITSSASNATDHVGGAYIAPPPRTALAPVGGACFRDTSDVEACLLPGSYQANKANLGPNLYKLRSFTITPGASMNVRYNYTACKAGCLTQVNTNYTTNTTIADPILHPAPISKDLGYITNNKVTNQFPITVSCGTKSLGFCIFSETNYTGDASCYGLGGDDLPQTWHNKVKSIRVTKGTQVELFGTRYGDSSGTMIAQDEPDLKELPIGDSNFSERLAAVWARDANSSNRTQAAS